MATRGATALRKRYGNRQCCAEDDLDVHPAYLAVNNHIEYEI